MIDLARDMPRDESVERSVLGSLLMEPCWLKVDWILTENCFTNPERQILFNTLKSMYENQSKVDIRTVWREVQKEKNKGELTAFYVADLLSSVGSGTHVVQHAEILREFSIRRNLINESHNLHVTAFDLSRDTFSLLGEFEAKIKGLDVDFTPGIKSPHEAAKKVLENYDKAKNREPIKGMVKSRLGDLDDLIHAFYPGELIILAARPGMGKSVAALTIARNNCKIGVRCVIFNLEMSDMSMINRMACAEAAVNSYYVKRGELDADSYLRFANAVGKIAEYPLGIDDTGGIELSHLCSRIRKYIAKFPDTELVIVDYLQLVTVGKNHRVGNREQEVSAISKGLKALAKELLLPVIALSQLSRESEKEKEYSLRHLRESGSLEQDADMVAFIHRHAYGKPEGEDIFDEDGNNVTDRIDFIIKKHREGAVGVKSGIIKIHHQNILPTISEFKMPTGGAHFDNFGPTKPLTNFYEVEKEDNEPF